MNLVSRPFTSLEQPPRVPGVPWNSHEQFQRLFEKTGSHVVTWNVGYTAPLIANTNI
jgi:hypothetical protein